VNTKLVVITLLLVSAFVVWFSLCVDRVDPFVKNIRSPRADVREDAIRLLIAEKRAHLFIPELFACYADPSAQVNGYAVLALNTARLPSSDSSPAMPRLKDALGDSNPAVRVFALRVCGLPDPRYDRAFSSQDDKDLLELVIRCIPDQDTEVKVNALEAITWIALGANQELHVVEVLCKSLDDQSAKVRAKTARALGRIGKFTRIPRSKLGNAVACLRVRLADEDRDVQAEVQWALEHMSDSQGR
jgi:hypothetical protein